ncbi:MAG: right-handed parallel beta-helix repeat-containing protein [Cyanobacteriota bacterium]|nr:right-handed parallel beta-helix repeat-containing protein [Cyanobacteriota bacterium]
MKNYLFSINRRQFLQALGILTGVSLAKVTYSSTATEKRIYYVSSSGQDSNPGTFEQPWKTIQKAAETLVAGDTVYIREGTYTITQQIVPRNSGTENQWIIYAGYPGETVIIDADNVFVGPPIGTPPFPRDQGAFQIQGKHHILIKNLTLKNSHNGGFVVRESHHIDFYNNTTINTFSSGILIGRGCYQHKVFGNTVINANTNEMRIEHPGYPYQKSTGPHEGITMGSVEDFEVAYNQVCYCAKEGIDCKGTAKRGKVHHNYVHHCRRQGLYADSWQDVLEDIEFFENIVHDCEAGVAIAAEDGPKINSIQIHHNLIFNNRATGIFLARWGKDKLKTNIQIYNNTIHHNGYGLKNTPEPYWLTGGLYFYTTNLENVRVENNIFSDNAWFQIGYSSEFKPDDFQQKNIQILSNLIFDNNTVTYPVFLEEWAKDRVYATKGEDFLEADPLFEDPRNVNFYLQTASPAAQRNLGSFAANTTKDFWWTVNFPPQFTHPSESQI